jgi:DNA gyrase/topoisomerase IV subunit B
MPVDMHPEQNMPGVEVILTQLHSGGKFSNKNYQFSGGLHGVGVSVVNPGHSTAFALSTCFSLITETLLESKYLASGIKCTMLPVFSLPEQKRYYAQV